MHDQALLVMDLQSGIVDQMGVAAELLERARAALGAARAHGVATILVRVAFRDGLPEVSPVNKSFGPLRGNGAFFHESAASTAIDPALEATPSDIVVTKRRLSAFAGSDLDVVLRSKGVRTLVLSGVATSGVVLSTLRQAADMDYELVVLSDACADPDAEVHSVLLEKLFPSQATVRTVDEWSASLAAG